MTLGVGLRFHAIYLNKTFRVRVRVRVSLGLALGLALQRIFPILQVQNVGWIRVSLGLQLGLGLGLEEVHSNLLIEGMTSS